MQNIVTSLIIGSLIGIAVYFFVYCRVMKDAYPNGLSKEIFENNFSKLSDEDLETIESIKVLIKIQKMAEGSNIRKYYKEDLVKEIKTTYRCISSEIRDRFGEEYIQYLIKEKK